MSADRQRLVEVTRRSDAPVEAVWALLADGASWSEWAPFSRSVLEREGTPPPDGVGAVRVFSTGPRSSREEVVAFEPPVHLGYVMLSGPLPIRNYRSDVTLAAAPGGGTDITWRSTFETGSPATGWFWAAFIGFFVRSLATRLAKAAAVDS